MLLFSWGWGGHLLLLRTIGRPQPECHTKQRSLSDNAILQANGLCHETFCGGLVCKGSHAWRLGQTREATNGSHVGSHYQQRAFGESLHSSRY